MLQEVFQPDTLNFAAFPGLFCEEGALPWRQFEHLAVNLRTEKVKQGVR
jgi:hypothetical protein